MSCYGQCQNAMGKTEWNRKKKIGNLQSQSTVKLFYQKKKKPKFLNYSFIKHRS